MRPPFASAIRCLLKQPCGDTLDMPATFASSASSNATPALRDARDVSGPIWTVGTRSRRAKRGPKPRGRPEASPTTPMALVSPPEGRLPAHLHPAQVAITSSGFLGLSPGSSNSLNWSGQGQTPSQGCSPSNQHGQQPHSLRPQHVHEKLLYEAAYLGLDLEEAAYRCIDLYLEWLSPFQAMMHVPALRHSV